MKNLPLITVAVPSYNHEPYVESAVRSVLEQDYPRVELILIDDMSMDGTWDVVRSLEAECRARCERVIIDRNESNKGTCETLNRLCGLATGDFFIPLASDDRLLPGALTALVGPMLADHGIGVVVGQNRIMDGEGRICFWDKERNNVYDQNAAEWRSFNEHLQSVTGVDQYGGDFGTYSSLVRSNHIANGYLIRKSLLDKVLPFTKEAPLEDHWLHLQLSKITKYKAVSQYVFAYRWHASNTIKQVERMKRYWSDTLLWEARRVEELGGEWKELFHAVIVWRKREWSIGGMIRCYRVRARLYKWHELRVCGLRFVFRKRSCSLAW